MDPDLQIRGGAPGHPDPEIRGGGGGLQKNFFGPLGAASVWSKNKRGAQASQAPPLDPPLLDTKWAVDHSPTPICQNVICLVRWQANLFEILTVSIESAYPVGQVCMSRQLFKQRLKLSCFMELLESSEGRKLFALDATTSVQ